MKFQEKLFLWIMGTLTIIFMIFGGFMLSTYFGRTLNREITQADTESQMFQYLFEMAYVTIPKEYGGSFSIDKITDSVMKSIEKEGNTYYIYEENKKILFRQPTRSRLEIGDAFLEMMSVLDKNNTYGYQIMKVDDSYYLLTICLSNCDGEIYYLGIQKDISFVYQERQILLNQYRILLLLLLSLGAVLIFLLAKYITKPIKQLTQTTQKIAAGDYHLRVEITSKDEIGELSKSFNQMTDNLLNRMKEKELEAKQKADFTTAFAHELKTPLTSIIGYSDMLSTMQLTDAEKSEASYYIFTQGKRLERLSFKLLELFSLEKQEIKRIKLSAKKMEELLKTSLRPVWESKNITGKIIMEKGTIYGDMDLLLSLLLNLLDNAAKAITEGDFILLKGISKPEGYEIKVVDSGRGIPENEIERVTEAFYMVDKSRARKEGGAGIGMSLCQKIIELHGGSMQIGSRVGEGTVIRIFLPKENRYE
ncbi:HAMP domain-containing histidine kinase [Lachnospiraceae bacterium OttesenSCG-928-D06]|nr:HAMP domain-containing histidine kinase [Lachnospiraceae bacterium OttesenSCG-928-D06]